MPEIFRSDSLSEFFDKEHPLGISGTCEMAAAASGIVRQNQPRLVRLATGAGSETGLRSRDSAVVVSGYGEMGKGGFPCHLQNFSREGGLRSGTCRRPHNRYRRLDEMGG